jgi:hypothetical protein
VAVPRRGFGVQRPLNLLFSRTNRDAPNVGSAARQREEFLNSGILTEVQEIP